MARRVELSDDALVVPPALAARATLLALGDQLLVLSDDSDKCRLSSWRQPVMTASSI